MLSLKKSKLRVKLLVYFFDHPGVEEYVRALARLIKVDPTNLSRELKRLETDGLFKSKLSGNQKYYYLNKSYPYFNEIKKIVLGTLGIENQLKKALNNIKNIKSAFIYGSYARGEEKADSDIDLMIIGRPNKDELIKKISRLEKENRKEINYRIISEKDISDLLVDSSFIRNVINNKKIFIKGGEKEFTTTYRFRQTKERNRNRI